jgi:DNA helicase II / ATP-dependent DNA helicase PcrA
MRREPQATARDFTRYLAAVAESGLREEEATGTPTAPAVQVRSMSAARGLEFDHVFVLGLSAARMPGPFRPEADGIPAELLKGRRPALGDREAHEAEMRRLLHLAMTRARKGLVLAWAEAGAPGTTPRPSPFYEEAMAATAIEEEVFEEELFGPAEGLHSTFRIMRDELLDTVARMGGRLGEMRLDTYLDVDQAVSRYLELIKVAALIERAKEGQTLDAALPAVNEILLQCATPEQREMLEQSALDGWLRDTERDPAERPASDRNGSEPSLDPFIPRRGRGLMLSASDIDTYRICPLKYKFARVFRIPQEPTIYQRFGIVLHQVLERFHGQKEGHRSAAGRAGRLAHDGSLAHLMELFEASWRRSGFGDSDDEQQFRKRAVAALESYWQRDRDSDSEAVWFERSFAFRIGPHLLRGRVDRVDRHPDGTYELIDYKTGRAKTEEELREDVQLSVYQMGARESWGIETSAQSYFYVLTGEKVPVEHSDEELDRVRATVSEIAGGILKQRFEPTPSPEICSFCDYRIICPAAEK